MLVTCIFSFSHDDFRTHEDETNANLIFFITRAISICQKVCLGRSNGKVGPIQQAEYSISYSEACTDCERSRSIIEK